MNRATIAAQNGDRFDDRRDEDGIGALEPELVKNKACHAQDRDDGDLAIHARIGQDGEEVAPAERPQNEHRDRHQQRDLGDKHEGRPAELLGGEERKRLLSRDQEGGRHGVKRAKAIVQGGAGRHIVPLQRRLVYVRNAENGQAASRRALTIG
jgi:hypothetical protein